MLALLWRFYQLHQLKNYMTSQTRDNNGAVHEENEQSSAEVIFLYLS